ncbi:MAG TPA: M48 family metalloprotease [Burkholderiales bacterium]|nr:M48 family metalloprotease [Burkholderiales bacterium]
MRAAVALLSAFFLALPPASAQMALPDLGGAADASLPPQVERRIGQDLMREIRYRDPDYVDDAEVAEYLNLLGGRLVAVAPDVRQAFDFFAIRDGSVNAFALPGGFIGVNTGLIVSSASESELASVLAHEIAHVTQRHIARMVSAQEQMQVPMIAATIAAILLGASRPDLAQGAMATVQGVGVQSQLNYTRGFEREADRIGFQMLADAGFDPRAMAVFFEKLQRATAVMDDGRVPGYLRTHPMSIERMSDAQNRAQHLRYRQTPDSLDYHLIRAKLRAESGAPQDAVTHFAALLRDRRYANEAATRYGLARALLRAQRVAEAQAELERLRAAKAASPMIDMLAAELRHAAGDNDAALAILEAARLRQPQRRSLLYAYIGALQWLGRDAQALAALEEPLRLYRADAQLHALQAKSYAALGKRLLQHKAQAEVYVLRGALPSAIEQLELARGAGDGDFYQLSQVDARLRDLRAQRAQIVRDQQRR